MAAARAASAKRRPEPATLVSIPELARRMGVHRVTLHRRLMALEAVDAAARRKITWLFRPNPRRTFVNLSRLEQAHPALFHARFVSVEDLEVINDRTARLEARDAETRVRTNAIAASVRDVRSELGELEARVAREAWPSSRLRRLLA